MECSLKFILTEPAGTGEPLQGEARAVLSEEDLTVAPRHGEEIFISLRDIEHIAAEDYRLELLLSSGEQLQLFHLGRAYEDFLRELTRLRHELISKDLLMHERQRKEGQEARLAWHGADGAVKYEGRAELRLYETGLVIFPATGDPFRIPYSSIEDVSEGDYMLTLNTDPGERLVFSMMGRGFEPFREALNEVMSELSAKVQKTLQELLPEAGPALIRQAAGLMREGKAARRSDLEALSPQLWVALEQRLDAAGLRHEYDFLKELSRREKCCIGIKRGLMGDLTGDYIWLLMPLYSNATDKPGNAIAMAAASGKGGGRATYFFRMADPEEYRQYRDLEALDRLADTMITRINRCMLAINFRREPIYLSEEKLGEEQYRKYRQAVRKIPALQELRRLFIGRVFHRTPEQWEEEVQELLHLNNISPGTWKWSGRGQELADDECEAEPEAPAEG